MSAICRGCQKPIVWAETGDGKKIPLDPSAPVYRIDGGLAVLIERKARELQGGAMVSHFSTCAKAGDFGSSRGIVEAVKVCVRDRVAVDFGHQEGVAILGTGWAVLAAAADFEDAVAHHIIAKNRGGTDAPTDPA